MAFQHALSERMSGLNRSPRKGINLYSFGISGPKSQEVVMEIPRCSFSMTAPACNGTLVKSKPPFVIIACKAWAVAKAVYPTGYASSSDATGFTFSIV